MDEYTFEDKTLLLKTLHEEIRMQQRRNKNKSYKKKHERANI